MTPHPHSHTHNRRARPAISLLETILSISLMGVIGASVLPLVVAASESYEASSTSRRAMQRAAFALDRTLQILREAPGDVATGQLDIAEATPSRIVFLDNTGITLQGTTLMLIDEQGAQKPLCTAVTDFTITYLADDSTTDTITTPEITHRFNVSITTASLTLAGTAFARLHVLP